MNRWGVVVLAWLMCCAAIPVRAEDAPMFTDFDGQPRQVESYAGGGRWLVVMFWAHDCHVCNLEAGNYARFHDEHAGRDAGVLGISIDGQERKSQAESFVERHGLPFPNLIGEPAVGMLYFMGLTQEPFRGTPTFLLFGPDGELQAAQAGAVPVSSIEAYIAKHAQQAATMR